jgi:hypothetical protein
LKELNPTRLSLLLIVALLTVMLAGTQQSITSAYAPLGYAYEGALFREYGPAAAVSSPGRTNLFTGALTSINGTEAQDDALRLYRDLSTLSLRNRRAAYRNVTPFDRSKLWKVHLALFLAKRSELNEFQKAVILSGVAMATPEYFGTPSDDPAWKAKVQEPSRLLELQILNAFSREDAAKIFATLGDDAEAAKSSASNFLNNINYTIFGPAGPYKQLTLSKFVVDDFELEQTTCACSMSSDYCPLWSACRSSSCATTADGCGTFWSWPCNGACR